MKKVMLICAPVSSRSGYGDHARDLVRSFLKLDKFNIKMEEASVGFESARGNEYSAT